MLDFPLKDIKQYIENNPNNENNFKGINKNNEIELIECFNYFHRKENIYDYCERCGNNNAQISSRKTIINFPLFLILIFNRTKENRYHIKINFPELLYCQGICLNQKDIYQLYGVVKYYEYNSSTGKYASYCRSPIDKCWYFYNDDIVSSISEQDKYQIQENGLTDVLFYKCMKDNEKIN